ncbi:MAG: transcription termination/antitermination factor NusG [Treponema sp.]|jgi:transcriptional antiterminator NusG|nr:transcription termination/antitermination factor NusG [Treponema sp.]
MAKGWYILHVFSGYEAKIERTIRTMIEQGELSSENVLDIKVPVETVVDVKDGKKKEVKKLLLPGYIMVELDLPGGLGWKPICALIRRINGVTGFVGTSNSERPRPIPSEEAKALLQKAGDIKGEKTPRAKQSFSVGETVKVIDGPFASFTGTIDEVNLEKNKLKVVVGIFGRATPVEVDLLQVEKV